MEVAVDIQNDNHRLHITKKGHKEPRLRRHGSGELTWPKGIPNDENRTTSRVSVESGVEFSPSSISNSRAGTSSDSTFYLG